MSDRLLAGRRALVTGASRGIGEATARALAAAGALVAVTARSDDAVRALAESLGKGHVAIAADLTTNAGVDAVVKATQRWAAGAPDIIVNNAGAFAHAEVESQDPDAFGRMLRLNLESPFRVVHAFVGAMRERKSGDIVTVGSVSDKNAFTGNAAYSASKFGLRAVHEVLRAETRGSGVRAILVSPGPVDTDIWIPVEEQLGRRLPSRKTMLIAADVARAILYAVSQPAHVDVDELRLSRS